MKRASVTVEASFIIPLVVGIIISLLCMSMMQYDRGIVYMELGRYVENECKNRVNGYDSWNVSEVEDSIRNTCGKKLLLYELININCVSESDEVVVTVTLHTELSDRFCDFNISVSKGIRDYCKTLRMAEIVG